MKRRASHSPPPSSDDAPEDNILSHLLPLLSQSLSSLSQLISILHSTITPSNTTNDNTSTPNEETLYLHPSSLEDNPPSTLVRLLQIPKPIKPANWQGYDSNCPKVYLLSEEKLKEAMLTMLQQGWMDNATDCWITTAGAPRDAYWRISIGPGVNHYLVHHISLAFYYQPLPNNKKMQVSHLCHNRRCFNPKHLFVESVANNNLRKKCLKAKSCICHLLPKCLI